MSTTLKKLSPVLFVEDIEPCLEFWIDRLGFTKTVEVPEGNQLGFAIVVKDGIEVMYQSRASVKKDLPALAQMPSCTALYIEVENLDQIAAALNGIVPVVARRKTAYGSEEIFVREPGGNIIGFAQQQF